MSSIEYDVYSMYHETEYFEPQVLPYFDVQDYKDWTEICGTFIADGGEKYLTFGSFSKNIQYHESANFNKKSDYYKYGFYVYYYLDDIQLFKISEENDCDCSKLMIVQKEITNKILFSSDSISVGESIILKNVYFTLNDSILVESSFGELDNLFYTLDQNIELKISIIGHTDSSGEKEYNNTLSLARANAVKNYLISKGISPDRLTSKGLGSSQPLGNIDSYNRRVEFIITQK
jgi:outer membrane protein OmpA-like peptidoglycan-associated protein